jgi:hypothetical protein
MEKASIMIIIWDFLFPAFSFGFLTGSGKVKRAKYRPHIKTRRMGVSVKKEGEE